MEPVPALNWPPRLFRDVGDHQLIDDSDPDSFAEEADLLASVEALATGNQRIFAIRYRYLEDA